MKKYRIEYSTERDGMYKDNPNEFDEYKSEDGEVLLIQKNSDEQWIAYYGDEEDYNYVTWAKSKLGVEEKLKLFEIELVK